MSIPFSPFPLTLGASSLTLLRSVPSSSESRTARSAPTPTSTIPSSTSSREATATTSSSSPCVPFRSAFDWMPGADPLCDDRQATCEPQGYQPMDAPENSQERHELIGNFRKLDKASRRIGLGARAQSWAGTASATLPRGGSSRPGTMPLRPHSTAPSGQLFLAFNAGSAALDKRRNGSTIDEENDPDFDSSFSSSASGDISMGSPVAKAAAVSRLRLEPRAQISRAITSPFSSLGSSGNKSLALR